MERDQILKATDVATVMLGDGPAVRLPPDANPNHLSDSQMKSHLRWLLTRIPGFVEEGRNEKAQRWLSFVQGALWWAGAMTVENAKRANMPTGVTYSESA